MRKNLFLCGAVLVAMSSCSNESVPGVDEGVENDLVPVNLGLRMNSANVDGTRGTGTVGGTTEETNVWRSENLYVLMTSSDEDALEKEVYETDGWGFTSVKGQVWKEQFDNTFYSRPVKSEREGKPVWVLDYTCGANKNTKYYPANGESDFFAYHVDDAAQNTDENGNPVYVKENNTIYVPFKIDGSQDLLVGRANNIPAGKSGFSAKTARETPAVIPSIQMKHLLTRLTFTLHNGNANTSNITVNKISIKSKCSGKMYVAYQSEPATMVVWDDAEEELCLQNASNNEDVTSDKPNLQPFTPIQMTGDTANDQNVGEALFVYPDVTEYNMTITVQHTINGQIEEVPVPLKIPAPNGTFGAGNSYHVVATIYGFESITVDVDLEQWNEYRDPITIGGDE